MYQIDQPQPSREFIQAWTAAGQYLSKQGGDASLSWLRANLYLPFVEHLSFALGNQLFFIFVEAAEYRLEQKRDFFIEKANEANAIPCVMHMEKRLVTYEPRHSCWGLVNAITEQPVNPPELVTDELIEMSEWELQDFAVEVVCSNLETEISNILEITHQSSLSVDPAIWFKTDQGVFWIVVRAARYPENAPQPPDNIEDLYSDFSPHADGGYFAGVAVANLGQSFEENSEKVLALYREHGMCIQYHGLQKL